LEKIVRNVETPYFPQLLNSAELPKLLRINNLTATLMIFRPEHHGQPEKFVSGRIFPHHQWTTTGDETNHP